MKQIVVLLGLILLAGCSVLARHDRERVLQLAVQDDQACQTQGWHYPQPRYVSCRMHLEDQRQYRDWMNLQIMHQSQYQNPSAPPPYPYHGVYRPLNRDRYHCRYVTDAGKDYVLCGEQSRG